jgi:hypothetical protein
MLHHFAHVDWSKNQFHTRLSAAVLNIVMLLIVKVAEC